ncbi:TPA: antibiotic biosynthesis monooxygenase [Acinetobacter baumannii]|uniref:antibiotic biosynthesis monooxygenase family protein n=1 Tax=Acinetobacter baumannii TaxID=470 RepID=UPI0003F785DE|nr:antibiotic biosynthesis monooxygenase [Acinetobacter baumannii]RSP33707.1 antibiotic biosynthesis monooxygenase [Acinetobacter baumannii]HBN5964922.1 antibiotic biosynthesis monooxygenase [Acinetobacter baumannii]
MIIEHVNLKIKSGQSEAFLKAFEQAKHIVSLMEGFNAVQLIKHTTDPHHYILMIFWDEIENHTEGFRKSEAYQEWKKLLHPFYDPMPTVEYYEPSILLKKNDI